jgi:uncharacterized membrane protein
MSIFKGVGRGLGSARKWLKPFQRWSAVLILGVVLILFVLGPLLGVIRIYRETEWDAGLFLLSAVAQSLSAILALVITITLITAQLAAQTYTPHVMRLKLRDPVFWFLIGLYVLTIGVALLGMGWFKLSVAYSRWPRFCMETTLLLAGLCLLYLIPYTNEAINSLRPKVFARKLLKRDDSDAVEELLHRAVSEGFITIVDEVGAVVDDYVMERWSESRGRGAVLLRKRPGVIRMWPKGLSGRMRGMLFLWFLSI